MLLSWIWPRDGRCGSGESPSQIGGFVGYVPIGFQRPIDPPASLFALVSCVFGVVCINFIFLFCFVGFGARGPFTLQAPWREGFGGCCSQGCHGYPLRWTRSDSWPHLPYFRHHSPSLSIVMSLNNWRTVYY